MSSTEPKPAPIEPAGSNQDRFNSVRLATASLEYMDRAPITGQEAQAFLEAKQWLLQLRERLARS